MLYNGFFGGKICIRIGAGVNIENESLNGSCRQDRSREFLVRIKRCLSSDEEMFFNNFNRDDKIGNQNINGTIIM